MKKGEWMASDYLDNGQWGVLDSDNCIVVGAASRITEELADQIAREHNICRSLRLSKGIFGAMMRRIIGD